MRSSRRGLVMVTGILVAIGIVMIYSTSAIYAHETYSDATFFLKRHLIYLGIGLALGGWILSVDPGKIRRFSKPFLGICLLLLLAVLIPGIGHRVSGATRWFRLGWISIQPSELAQLAMIVYMADLLTRKRGERGDFFQGLLPILIVLGLTVGLILVEPDLGTAAALCAVALLMLFVASIRGKLLLPLVLAAIPAVIGLVLMKPYRVRRVLAYLNPWADPEGAGFQLIQSLVALGSGGLTGFGLGESRQKLFYLPAAHTDFIFAVIGEELGFWGTTGIMILICLLVWFGIRVALSSPDTFGAFAGFGIVCLLALEALIHIAVTLGAIPTKGLPLPFISYGGTALIVNLVSVAVLLNVSRHPEQVAI